MRFCGGVSLSTETSLKTSRVLVTPDPEFADVGGPNGPSPLQIPPDVKPYPHFSVDFGAGTGCLDFPNRRFPGPVSFVSRFPHSACSGAPAHSACSGAPASAHARIVHRIIFVLGGRRRGGLNEPLVHTARTCRGPAYGPPASNRPQTTPTADFGQSQVAAT